ncbi:uracil-DNA glycosylase-like protein [Suillus clintonianus]|uniref:uracil-DNA glycosylase-like protein n=1 Tax=Suillus clintonianus TaxID=1904413 RepID=UPI001B87915A|nr:uracil-DNA glycosylase-like protein [Suillus clintonianus]KAG2138938.1 uracil-DNA glycosylase-like protein [Suillus clintonianus]
MSSVSRKRVASSSAGSSSTKRRKIQAKSSTVTVTTVVEESRQNSVSDIKAVIENLEHHTMGDSWRTALEKEFMKPYFQKLKEFLIAEHHTHTVYPKLNDIYSWSRLTPLDSVKAVILGQDPYHNVGQAHGLSFSVLPPTKLPGSLKNIYKQLSSDIPAFKVPTSGDLTPTAKAGVLWLNTCLTVRAHNANSHSKKGWETFTDAVIRAVLDRPDGRGVVFFAWGLPAQKLYDRLGIDEEKHLLLRSPHPSPLSAHRGFLGNGHFKKANEWLQNKHGEEIDWASLGSVPHSDADN